MSSGVYWTGNSCVYCSLQVMMKDLVTPVSVEEIRTVVRKCLENAALINYTKVTEMAKAEGKISDSHAILH